MKYKDDLATRLTKARIEPTDELLRFIDLEVIPLKAKLFQTHQLLNKINIALRNGGYSSHEELGKLYEETNLILNK